MEKSTKPASRIKQFFRILGPGLITGASDDDPSGIATYSQAGAGFGLNTLWTAVVTFPLMATIQGMCARIGLVTQAGLTGTLKKHYHKSVLYFMLALSFPAIVLNIGADIEAMGAVSNLLIPFIPGYVFSFVFTALLMYAIIRYPYQKIAGILKWLCIAVLIYIVVAFMAKPNWGLVLKNTFVPTIHFNKEYLSILVAILGTTISPYLFFWQATMEAEDCMHGTTKVIVDKRMLNDMRKDVNLGMFFSCLVMFFITLTTGVVLFNAGIHKIDTESRRPKHWNRWREKAPTCFLPSACWARASWLYRYWPAHCRISWRRPLTGKKGSIKSFRKQSRFIPPLLYRWW